MNIFRRSVEYKVLFCVYVVRIAIFLLEGVICSMSIIIDDDDAMTCITNDISAVG